MSLHWRAWVHASVLIAALTVSGCQTTGQSDYSEWEDILEPQSLLEVKALQNRLYYVWRKRRTGVNVVQEYWRWQYGELFVADLYPGVYYTRNFGDRSLLLDYADGFKQLKKVGVTVRTEDVQIATDSQNNRVPYAVVTSENGKVICFVAARATRTVRGGDRPVTSNPIARYVVLYQCTKTESVDRSETFTNDGLALIDHIKVRK